MLLNVVLLNKSNYDRMNAFKAKNSGGLGKMVEL